MRIHVSNKTKKRRLKNLIFFNALLSEFLVGLENLPLLSDSRYLGGGWCWAEGYYFTVAIVLAWAQDEFTYIAIKDRS